MDSLTKEIEALHTQVTALTLERNDLAILLDNWKVSQGITEDQLTAMTQERDAAVAIIEQTLCGISFGELRKAYAAYRAGEKYETVVDRIDAELAASQAREAKLREALKTIDDTYEEGVKPGPCLATYCSTVAHAALALPTDELERRKT